MPRAVGETALRAMPPASRGRPSAQLLALPSLQLDARKVTVQHPGLDLGAHLLCEVIEAAVSPPVGIGDVATVTVVIFNRSRV